ncbi:hypothetical protein ACQR50_04230 [Sphingomonas sp. Xoc002]|uniref:hypothetical protein n=1 Tax=Sphingomonas sp. Xoc002 TaxID=2837624 RepID=UPI003D18702B
MDAIQLRAGIVSTISKFGAPVLRTSSFTVEQFQTRWLMRSHPAIDSDMNSRDSARIAGSCD